MFGALGGGDGEEEEPGDDVGGGGVPGAEEGALDFLEEGHLAEGEGRGVGEGIEDRLGVAGGLAAVNP